MKMKWCFGCFLVLVLCAGFQLCAEETNELFEVSKVKAETGDAWAECFLGLRYDLGMGTPVDYAEALKWYRKAAAQGERAAQCNLGVMYHDGKGVTQDYAEAVKWFRKAAEQGYADAQCNLGVMYHDGKGVTQDYTEALKWYQKASGQGNGAAQCNLGQMYRDGQGVKQDYVEAAKLFRMAAEQGFVNAQNNLGVMYFNGQGLPKDYVQAYKWYRKGAEQGDATTQNNLGLMYFIGQGLPKDYVQAYKWYNLAAAQGDTNAINNRLNIASVMTPEQIAEAQQLSAAFVPQKETPDSSSNSSSLDPNASGTGFFITEDGYLISNFHVVEDASKVRLRTSAGLIDAKVVQTDAANDIALLKAEGKFSALPIAASRAAGLGDTVFTLGFPDPGLQGFAPKLAKGEIASLAGAADDARYFQVSVPVQPGNSGGALVDARGNVIGIVSAKLDAATALAASGALPENVNYAVKSSFLLSFLESVPAVDAELKPVKTSDEKFSDAVKSVEQATVLVLVY
jgi:uncharacterized protein